MTRYIKAFSWTKTIQDFLKEVIKERPILSVCAGESEFGDIRIDRYHSPFFYPITARADMTALPFKDDSFGCVFCDPPWNKNVMVNISQFGQEALRVAPILYLMSPWIWGTSRALLTDSWVRQMPGVNQAILITRYERKVAT